MADSPPTEPAKSQDQQLDQICLQFAKELHAGERPNIEDFLGRVSEDCRETLLSGLLAAELHYRKANGTEPDLSAVQDRFPDFRSTVSRCFLEERHGSVETQEAPAAKSQSPEYQPGQRLGRYTIVREIGVGAFGVVYLARDPSGDEFAIKVLRAEGNTAGVTAKSFLREVERLERLSHPNIIRIVEAFDAVDDQLCIVTEYAAGGPLSDKIRYAGNQADQWEPKRAARLIGKLALALDSVHEAGLVHRDIKPDNILLDAEDEPKLADVGLALDEAEYGKGDRSIAGTFAYLSPEAAKGDAHLLDQRADIYSLGLVLYEMLTARRGFSAETRAELLRRIQEVPLRPVRGLNPSVPASLEAICHKATAKDPEQRYFTGGDMAADLRAFVNSNKKHSMTHVVGFVFAAVVMLLLFGLFAWPNRFRSVTGGQQSSLASPDDSPAQQPVLINSFDVLASRDGGRYDRVEDFDASGGLRKGDAIRFSARLNQPAYVKILWVDAHGQPVEFYPRDPSGTVHGEERTDRIECPKSLLEGFEPLDPTGFSESAFLIVAKEPIGDLSKFAARSEMDVVRDAPLDGVNRYEALASQPTIKRLGTANAFRGIGGNIKRVEDPILEFLEQVRNKVDAVHAIRIPMKR